MHFWFAGFIFSTEISIWHKNPFSGIHDSRRKPLILPFQYKGGCDFFFFLIGLKIAKNDTLEPTDVSVFYFLYLSAIKLLLECFLFDGVFFKIKQNPFDFSLIEFLSTFDATWLRMWAWWRQEKNNKWIGKITQPIIITLKLEIFQCEHIKNVLNS